MVEGQGHFVDDIAPVGLTELSEVILSALVDEHFLGSRPARTAASDSSSGTRTARRAPVAERDSLREMFAEYARTGDVVLRDQLVAAHMGLAAYLARRFANRGQPLDDLVQVASLGLLKAVDRFDPGLGVEFSTYATTTIVGELKRHLRDKGWAVRAPAACRSCTSP